MIPGRNNKQKWNLAEEYFYSIWFRPFNFPAMDNTIPIFIPCVGCLNYHIRGIFSFFQKCFIGFLPQKWSNHFRLISTTDFYCVMSNSGSEKIPIITEFKKSPGSNITQSLSNWSHFSKSANGGK